MYAHPCSYEHIYRHRMIFKKASFRLNSFVGLVPAIYVSIRLAGKDETGYRKRAMFVLHFPVLNIKTINFEIIM